MKLEWIDGYPPECKCEHDADIRRETVAEALETIVGWNAFNKVPVQLILEHFGLREAKAPTCQWCGLPDTSIVPGDDPHGVYIPRDHECPPVELMEGDKVSFGPLVARVLRCGQDLEWEKTITPSQCRRHNPGDPPDGRRCK